MKLKIFFISLISLFILLCFSQIFNIYPSAENVFVYYKSGYFKELDTQFNVIADTFIEMKMMTKAEILKENTGSVSSHEYTESVYSWILLDDISKKYGIEIKVYDRNGNYVPIPDVKLKNDNPEVQKLINSVNFNPVSMVKGGYYKYILPVKTEQKCLICHKNTSLNQIAGVLTFSRKYNTYIYYGSERIILFSILAFSAFIMLFFVIRWDPEKNIKELFDKTE